MIMLVADFATLIKYKLDKIVTGKWAITYTYFKNLTPALVVVQTSPSVLSSAIVADMAAVQVAQNVTFQ